MFYHEKLWCYQRGIQLSKQIMKEIKYWPRGYSFLVDQIKRALGSVILNLAEGNNRKSSKERRRFFEISKASAAEVAAALDLASVYNLISINDHAQYKDELCQIARMVAKLR